MALVIRGAAPADAALIVKFVAELAAYENLSHEARVSEAEITRDLFGPSPKVFCEIAEADGVPRGEVMRDEWTKVRVDGEALSQLASP